MEDNDLKKIWKEMHTGMECKSIDIKEIIHKKHSVVISRILHRQKSLICLFAFFFILSVTSNIWHSVLMGRASFLLWVVNIFLLFMYGCVNFKKLKIPSACFLTSSSVNCFGKYGVNTSIANFPSAILSSSLAFIA